MDVLIIQSSLKGYSLFFFLQHGTFKLYYNICIYLLHVTLAGKTVWNVYLLKHLNPISGAQTCWRSKHIYPAVSKQEPLWYVPRRSKTHSQIQSHASQTLRRAPAVRCGDRRMCWLCDTTEEDTKCLFRGRGWEGEEDEGGVCLRARRSRGGSGSGGGSSSSSVHRSERVKHCVGRTTDPNTALKS